MKKNGIPGGTGTVLLANINSADIVKTAVLAAVGALVSAIVTLFLNKWLRKDKTHGS